MVCWLVLITHTATSPLFYLPSEAGKDMANGMIVHQANPFVLGPAKSGPDNADPGRNTDSIVSEGIAGQMRQAGRQISKNLSSEEDGVGESPTEGEMSADPPTSSVPKLPGQGYGPLAKPTAEEGPVIIPQDIKQIDGEGNMTDASSDVDMNDMVARRRQTQVDTDAALSSVAKQVAKDYQAPEPDGPYNDGPGNPSSDPLTGQVQGMHRPVGPTYFDEAIGRITPPDAATVLRPPTLTSGEIGGRLTDDGDSGI